MPTREQQRNIWHRKKKVCFQHLLVQIERRSDVELRHGHQSFTEHINLCSSNWYSLRFFKKWFTGKLFRLMATTSGQKSPLSRWLKLSCSFFFTSTRSFGCGNESLCKQFQITISSQIVQDVVVAFFSAVFKILHKDHCMQYTKKEYYWPSKWTRTFPLNHTWSAHIWTSRSRWNKLFHNQEIMSYLS